VYDYDVVLLITRCMVLRHAGFHVDSASSAEQFQERIAQAETPYRLLLLGHTVPDPDQARMAVSVANSTTLVFQTRELVPPMQLIDDVRLLFHERRKS
jgi:hypothetical protein